jgi:hypothetical protein
MLRAGDRGCADRTGRGEDVREPLVVWAEDCVVRGDVELADGRLSDLVNELEFLTFSAATLEALDDGRRMHVDELEVERRDLHLIEVRGRRGDPVRRLRTVEERVVLEVGPFTVTGNLHRPPNTQPMAALSRRSKFVPVTDAVFHVAGDDRERREEVLLVNRERIARSHPLHYMPQQAEPWEAGPSA